MYEYLIYSRLKKYAKANKNFHMPGHKAKREFCSKFPVAPIDVTELSYSDNLHCPTDVIYRAQREIAEILGAKRSYITTDGSTSGVFTMLYVASKRGKKVIVPRNSHSSVWNACAVFGLEPLIVQGEEKEGVLQPPSAETIRTLLEGDPSVSAVLAVSPDYYGNVAPLEEYEEITKRLGRLLLVDQAHGTHLAFWDRNDYAGTYADMWVDGAHKTLPTLTQGAILNVNDDALIPDAEEGLDMFRTTSPSYPIMASVEYGVKYLANYPEVIRRAREAVEQALEILGLPRRPADDWTKLLIDFKPLGISADKVAELLEKRGVYPEFSDGRYILFYISPMTTPKDLKKLAAILQTVAGNKKLRGTYVEKQRIPVNERTYSFRYALNKPNEWIDLGLSAGRMCAKNAGVTPPCVPVVVAGEIITPAAIRALTGAKTVFGLDDGKICVVKN